MLLVGWSLLEGLGAALMMPTTIAFISATYHDHGRTFAFGIWSAVVSIAGFIGPILGSFITTGLNWRYGFALEVLIIVLMLIFPNKLIKITPTLTWKDLDIWGSLLSVSGNILTGSGNIRIK